MKTKTAPGPSVLKWSSKPADHNAVRVRNNQRRHRARAKEHVQDLEKRLEETSARLEAALQTIGKLAQEVEVLRGRALATPAWPQLSPPPVAAGQEIEGVAAQQRPKEPTPARDSPDPRLHKDQSGNVLEPAAPLSAPAAPTADVGDKVDCGCDGLPPQAPGESTLPCSSAFRIIEQQNFSGVGVTTIRAWLGPGLRRALKPGEACRVETNRVYELLDHITSSS